MKTLIEFSFIIVLFLCIAFVHQLPGMEYIDEQVCAFTEEEQEEIESTWQLGGLHITSIGTVRALMLFIDFSDDNEDPNNPNWPVGVGPSYLDNIIDPEEGYPAQDNNITSLLYDNSFGQFLMVGEAIYRQAPRSIDDYLGDPATKNNVAHWATWDVLANLDQEMDFSPYDKWEKIADYEHIERSDHLIDLIFVVFRRWYKDEYDDPIPGFGALGWSSMPGSGTLNVDEGERWIDFGRSGVTSLAGMPQRNAFQICLHEFGHKWGLPHNYNDGMWTLMSYWQHSVSPFMNSYERERLGWITFVDITENTNATIPDYGSGGIPFRMQINSNEYFLVENHQQNSPFDIVNLYDTDLNPFEAPGLYMLRLNNSSPEQKVKAVCADGKWNWNNPYWILNPFGTGQPGDSIPVYDRLDPNPVDGFSDKDRIPHTKGGIQQIHAWLDDVTGNEKHSTRFKGLGNSRWIPGGSNVFSPWSNPPSNTANGTPTTLGIEVTGQDPITGNINVKFYITNPESAPPARIHDLSVTINNGFAILNWTASTEPDFSHYEIWRKVQGIDPDFVYYTSTTNNSYNAGGYDHKFGDHVYFKVRVVDSSDKFSNFSNIVSTYVHAGFPFPGGMSPGSYNESLHLVPDEITLLPNYPNPFNPTTTIRFGFPEDKKVSFKIYSITGEEIASLLDGYQEKGYHELKWDGRNKTGNEVSSGMYFYVLRAGNQMLVRKMMYLK